MSLFNVYVKCTLRRNVDDGSISATWDDRYGDGIVPKDLQCFLAPEHRTWDGEWSVVASNDSHTVEPERFWFMLTKDTGAKEFGFCLRSFVACGAKKEKISECDVVLSNHCWPVVFFALLGWQRKMYARSVAQDVPKTKHLFLQRIMGSQLPGPGQGYRLNLPTDLSAEPVILRVAKTRFFYGMWIVLLFSPR